MRFLRWLLAGCPVVCEHGRRVGDVELLERRVAEWRHLDDGTLCWEERR